MMVPHPEPLGLASTRGATIAWVIFACAVVASAIVGILAGDLGIAFVGSIGSLLVLLTILRADLGILGLVILLPFNGLISQLLGTGALAMGFGAIKDIVLLLLMVALARHGKWRGVRIDIAVLVGGVLVFSLVSSLWAAGLESAAYGWRNDFEPLLLLVCVPALLDMAAIKRITTTMSATAQVTSAISVVTWFIGVPWLHVIGRLPVSSGESFPTSLFTTGNDWPRAFSPYVAPNEMAVAMVIIIAVIWSRQDWSVRNRLLLSVLPTIAIALSSSRSGQIGLALLLVALLARWLRGRRATFAYIFLGASAIAGGALAAVYVARQFASRVDPSLVGHASSILDTVPLLLRHPFGVGLGSVGPRAYRYLEHPYHVESFWLLVGLESGILVMLVFIALLTRLCVIGIRAKTGMAFLAPAAVLGSLVSQLVLPTLQVGAVSFTLWIVVGIGLAAAKGKSSDLERAAHGGPLDRSKPQII